MGSLHNLFGATTVVEVEVPTGPGKGSEFHIRNVCEGQTVQEVLRAVQVSWGMGAPGWGLGFGVWSLEWFFYGGGDVLTCRFRSVGKVRGFIYFGLFGWDGVGWGGLGWQWDGESVLEQMRAAVEERVRGGQLSAAEGAEVVAKARQSLQSYTYLG